MRWYDVSLSGYPSGGPVGFFVGVLTLPQVSARRRSVEGGVSLWKIWVEPSYGRVVNDVRE